MKKILFAAIFIVLLAQFVIAQCPSTLPQDISSRDNLSTDCLRQVSPEDLNSVESSQLSARWDDLSETQRQGLYQSRLSDFQNQFSADHNIILSDCAAGCRFENGMLYNEPSQTGISADANMYNQIAALPDGGFRVTSIGVIVLPGATIDCQGSECSADSRTFETTQTVGFIGIPAGTPVTFIQVLGGQSIAINDRVYTSQDGGVITLAGQGTNQQYSMVDVRIQSEGFNADIAGTAYANMPQSPQGSQNVLLNVINRQMVLGDINFIDLIGSNNNLGINADINFNNPQPLRSVTVDYHSDYGRITATGDPLGNLDILFTTQQGLGLQAIYSPQGTTVVENIGVNYYLRFIYTFR